MSTKPKRIAEVALGVSCTGCEVVVSVRVVVLAIMLTACGVKDEVSAVPEPPGDAGSIVEVMRPGLECLARENAVANERLFELGRERRVLEYQIAELQRRADHQLCGGILHFVMQDGGGDCR